jgi:hypothetical protein
MNMHIHIRARQLDQSSGPAQSGPLQRFLAFIAKLLASPKGDQGGWEGGARGL